MLPQLASTPDSASLRMLSTFRREGGEICLAFAGQQASGIACHDAGQWKLQHVLPDNAGPSFADQQAGSHDGELMAIAQSMAVGEPLDAAQERAVKSNGWR